MISYTYFREKTVLVKILPMRAEHQPTSQEFSTLGEEIELKQLMQQRMKLLPPATMFPVPTFQ